MDVQEEDVEPSTPIRNRSDRLLFSLAKFKQNAVIELDTLSDVGSSSKNKQSSNSCSSNESNIDNTTITSTTNDDTNDCNSEEECSSLTESLLKTSSIDDFRRFVKSFDSEENSNSIGNGEEKTPLLEYDGMELHSLTSSTDPE
jgi:hypothetical protein